jgi:hypothetical protein
VIRGIIIHVIEVVRRNDGSAKSTEIAINGALDDKVD